MPNIIVNFNLNSTKNSEFHKEKLIFAQKLLNYFNTRLNLNISIEYKDNFEFKHVNYSSDDYSCTSFVGNLAYWFIQDRSIDQRRLNNFIDTKKNIADNIKSPINTLKALDGLTQSDIDYFLFQKNKFKSLYQNFDCLTFLSVENQIFLKTSLNRICDELDKVA